MRRVVITGMGLVTPLGCDVDIVWRRLIAGQSGAGRIQKCDVSDLACQIACEVPYGDGTDGTFNPDDWVAPKDQRRMDDFLIYAVAAAKLAVKQSKWVADTHEKKCRTGVVVGSGIGGLPGIEQASITLLEKGPRRISPFFIPAHLINLASGHISIECGFKGPNQSIVSACSSGAHAIGDAARLIMWDDADVMVAGGTEAAICRLGIAGFAACKALSTSFNDEPERASRPYDKDRDGFVMGEGAGIVVLEELEHAQARGATIHAELIGYGLSGDAYHITSPALDGDGAYRSMAAALKRSGLDPSEIDYINAHGTSTPLGDEIELNAVERLFGEAVVNLAMSSTKSAIGHLLGAAGAVEVIFCILAMKHNMAPPTINLDNPSVDTAIDLVPHEPRRKEINVAMSNSFGFGGTNATLILKTPPN